MMNPRGTPENLVSSHPGNTNAVRHGVHSPRLIHARASELESSLAQSFTFTPTQLLALREAARCMAILDAIDFDLEERGLVDKRGEPRYLLNHRYRISRQLDQWLAKISETIERQTTTGESQPTADRNSYIRELQRIALGGDSAANVRDRLMALRELLRLGEDADDQGDEGTDADERNQEDQHTPVDDDNQDDEDDLLPGVRRVGPNLLVFPYPGKRPPNAEPSE